MARLRLLADDLTGALDSAARFVPLTGRVAVAWREPFPDGSVAVDSGTRDLPAVAARVAVERLAHVLVDGAPAFKKIDSLLRGHVAIELMACMSRFDHCVLAPAFPFQGRITRRGRQLARTASGWHDVGVDLPPDVARWVCDAETDVELDAIVAEGRRLPGRVLWCGTGGLAGALAGQRAMPAMDLPLPILVLIGSDHGVSAAQVAAAPHLHGRLPIDDHRTIRRSLERGAAAVTVALPAATPRVAAREAITAAFIGLLRDVPRPGTLFVSGGDTLRHLCDALDVAWLEVDGEVEPGVPTSWMRGGARDGQRLVSKSGAFGDTGFLARLLGAAR